VRLLFLSLRLRDPLEELLREQVRVRQPLAYAFLLARTGKLDAARPVLDEWIAGMECEPPRAKLMSLLAA
jgi:hypothetical protein